MSGLFYADLDVLLAKVETTYKTDSTPTGAANAILCRELSINPIEGNLQELDYVRAFLGTGKKIRTEKYASIQFKVDVVSGATPGTAPAVGPLLRACGHAETISAAAVTGTATAGSTTSITLAAGASAVDGAYIGAKISITGGAGNGQTASIKSYVGSTKVATLDRTLSVALDNTSQYSIAPFVRYNPISNRSTMESATAYYTRGNALRHKLLGMRGGVSVDLSVRQVGAFSFNMLGCFGTPGDASESGVAYGAWVEPFAVGDPNTYGQFLGKPFTGGATGFQFSKFMLESGIQPKYRNVVGDERVHITDRKSSGSITLDSFSVAEYDIWTALANNGNSTLGIEQKDSNGNSVRFDIPIASPNALSYGNDDQVSTNDIKFDARPLVGNDDYYITFR